MQKGSGLLIAGAHGGAGKTTVTCGLLATLRKRGLALQPFKSGPDYLDAGYLALAAGRPCVNLDLWLMPRSAVRRSFQSRAASCDIAVVEGMMGLYDGMGVDSEAVSTADLASLLRLPVVLVVDAGAMAESAAAVVHGFATYGRADVAGVVFNRVAGPRHFDVLKRAVEGSRRPVQAFGWLAADVNLEIPERHLGLASADAKRTDELFPKLAALFEKTVDVDAILGAARAPSGAPPKPPKERKARVKIAIARDAAFHFYYEENLEALRAAGAELVPFSPVADAGLPAEASGLYLGGGFPETVAQRLDENRSMREAVKQAVAEGMPTYAECGGLMYLTTNFVGTGVRAWEMVGTLPGEVRMERRLQHFGYVTATAERSTFLVEKGETLRGHEFHYSAWSSEGGDASIWKVGRPGRPEARREGHGSGSLHASYVHLHFASAPKLPGRFVKAAEEHARSMRKRKKRRR